MSLKIVLYYADWCGHCIKFKPEWAALEAKLAGNKQISSAAYEESKNPNEFKIANIDGFPTINIYKANRLLETYSGPRTAEAIMAHLNELHQNGGKRKGTKHKAPKRKATKRKATKKAPKRKTTKKLTKK